MKTREEIITSMCYTYRHDFGLVVDSDESLYTLSGITRNERQHIWNTMSQIFDNDIAPQLDEYNQLVDGESVVLPKSKEHAEAMIRVATFYLEHSK